MRGSRLPLRLVCIVSRDYTLRCSRTRMRLYSAAAGRTYDDAIELLNSLQTPFKVIEERKTAGIKLDEVGNQEMVKHLSTIGYSVADLDKLNVVHVAGTKGKGTTCAYVDSILAQYRKKNGYPKLKVGLYTSPHLIAVRERIRMDSAPISPDLFARYFYDVWDRLGAGPDPRPGYFRFLTLVSFHAFLQEGVNVAIYETGVGGRYDSTNIVEHPVCTGITHLGIDHTYTLGSTIKEIAWQKAGIFKKGCPAFTVRQVPEAAMMLKDCAEALDIDLVNVNNHPLRAAIMKKGVKIVPRNLAQISNAALGTILARTVLDKLSKNYENGILRSVDSESLDEEHLNQPFIDGLERMTWPGRFQKIKDEETTGITWHIDGAHTKESIDLAARWAQCNFSKNIKSNIPSSRVLIFNQQGDHDAMNLLKTLHLLIAKGTILPYHHIIFCPSAAANTSNSTETAFINHTHDNQAIAELSLQKTFAKVWASLESEYSIRSTDDRMSHFNASLHVLPSMEASVALVREISTQPQDFPNWENDTEIETNHDVNATKKRLFYPEYQPEWKDGSKPRIDVFVTGSLHLVGRALDVLLGPRATMSDL